MEMLTFRISKDERGDIIECLNSKGGGGTDPMPIFKYIEENDVNVDSMVCITDMEFNKFPSHVDYPLLWVSTNLRAKKATYRRDYIYQCII